MKSVGILTLDQQVLATESDLNLVDADTSDGAKADPVRSLQREQ